uniref:Proteasome assembly chaperone 4-like n=1 Tax=Parasteatoda tepidariorum TaxID=114398 RepID=A0A2L2YMA1_PARTP|nr:proteasome assembly chaperone 4 [Parasteatoda tepidariorum]XP_042903114.1 proteasome assembly chaperone 4 [Parasteatoda tepidariorum]
MEENSGQLMKTHMFESFLLDKRVLFYLIKMKDSLFLWIGDTGDLGSLAVAMKTPFNTYPTSCNLIGNFSDDQSCSIASKLCNKMGKQVFVSYNVSKNDNKMVMSVIERIMEEWTINPSIF